MFVWNISKWCIGVEPIAVNVNYCLTAVSRVIMAGNEWLAHTVTSRCFSLKSTQKYGFRTRRNYLKDGWCTLTCNCNLNLAAEKRKTYRAQIKTLEWPYDWKSHSKMLRFSLSWLSISFLSFFFLTFFLLISHLCCKPRDCLFRDVLTSLGHKPGAPIEFKPLPFEWLSARWIV